MNPSAAPRTSNYEQDTVLPSQSKGLQCNKNGKAQPYQGCSQPS